MTNRDSWTSAYEVGTRTHPPIKRRADRLMTTLETTQSPGSVLPDGYTLIRSDLPAWVDRVLQKGLNPSALKR
jgi:hypothetical protein